MFSNEEIAEVMAAEVGEIPAAQSRLILSLGKEEGGNAPHVKRVGIYQRPALAAEPQERKQRCPFKTEDERQCIYTVDRCPGHDWSKR
jgi:hypothetical protein